MRKNTFIPLLSLISILAYIMIVDSVWSWRDIAQQWQAVGWWLLIVAITLMLFTHLVRTYRFYQYFSEDVSQKGSLTFARLFSVSQTHNFLNSLLPFRTGELSFPALMKLEFDVPLIKSGSGLLWMRFLDLHTLGWFALIILCYTVNIPVVLTILMLLTALLVPLVVYLFAKKIEAYLMVEKLNQQQAKSIVNKLKNMLLKLLHGIPASPKKFFSTWLLTLLNWAVKFFAMALVIVLLMTVMTDINLQAILAALAGAIGGEVSAILPIHAPAGVGTYPAGVYFGMQLVGYEANNLAELGISVHAMIMISAIIGVILAQCIHLLFQSVFQKNRKKHSQSDSK